MNLRSWATPLVLGAVTLSSVTGLLLFFGVENGLSTAAHEWLGWALVGGAVAHAFTNRRALAAHLSGARGRIIVGVFVLFTIGVSIPWPKGGGAPDEDAEGSEEVRGGDGGGLRAAEAVLTRTSLDRLAPLSGHAPAELVDRLRRGGFEEASGESTILDFAAEREARDRALAIVFSRE